MADEPNPFPNWDEPATKGDVIRSMIYIQSVVTSLFGMTAAMRANDDETFKKLLDTYIKNQDDLRKLIAHISGRSADDE